VKVVVLTSDAPNQLALCHKLASVVEVAAIVVSRNIPRKAQVQPWRRVANGVEARVVGRRLVEAWRHMQARYLARWSTFPDVPRRDVQNVNDAETAGALERHAPDLVLVSGTNLVGKKLIDRAQAKLGMMNLHTGLSPYVKGAPNCTNWCLAEAAFHLIGNTVMWIDAGIDSGALVLTEQTPLTGNESLSELQYSVMEHGHDAYLRAVRALRDGAPVPRVAQSSISAGRTYRVAEWRAPPMIRAQLNFARAYHPAYFSSADYRIASSALRLVSLADTATMAHTPRPDGAPASPCEIRDTGPRNTIPHDDKILHFTTRPAGGVAPSAKETLVVADLDDSLDDAFRLARAHLDLGEAVRLIAPGVTLKRAWPSWVAQAPGLTLTEWGAFRIVPHVDATRTLRAELRAWVDDVFDGDFGGFAPNRVMFEAARPRLLDPALAVYPVAHEILRAFPGATIHCLSAPVASILRNCVTAPRGRVAGIEPKSDRAWRVRILGFGAAGEVAAIARLVAAYVRARPTFRAIHEHRRRHPFTAPSTWVGLIPDWPRINYHLLDALALPVTESNAALGVLLVGSLEPSRRDEADMRKQHASDLWPGLGDLRGRLAQCALEQAVMPEDPVAFARSVTKGALRSARALRHLASARDICVASLRFTPRVADLVKWATIDVLRATLADDATRILLTRRPMTGTAVVFVANNVAWAPTDLALQRAHAITMEHDHGAHVDSGATVIDTESSLRFVWTAPDARLSTLPRERLLVAGMPVRMRFSPRDREARNVLILTNYAHRDWSAAQCRALRVFQSEILDIPRLLYDRGRHNLRFRWRPHPADVDAEVRRELTLHTNLELSRHRALEEDAGWCDIIVSATSTTVVESMFAGVPVFVHVLPDTWSFADTAALAPERVFYHAQRGASLVADWTDRYGSHPAAGLEPERRARVVLFGESSEPLSMIECLEQVRARSSSLVVS
jgi:methionyl-tRNA formyltransferase